MSYQIQPLREFLVRPALPTPINRLSELAYNLLWSWDHTIRSLFRRLDPSLWKESNHNPIQLLGPLIPTIVLLYDGELLDELPAGPLDRPVRMAAQPATGVTPVGYDLAV
jgi:hypothetical protein